MPELLVSLVIENLRKMKRAKLSLKPRLALTRLLLCFFMHMMLLSQIFAQQLEITGPIKIIDGNQGNHKVLTSDSSGLASWQTPVVKNYSIGDFALGGIIFWLDESGQHGLICAKNDQSAGIRWEADQSGRTMAKGDGPYAGEMNTAIIIATQSVFSPDDEVSYAARLCAELQIIEGGKTYGDWYLPSKEELNLMYLNKETINTTAGTNGGSSFTGDNYWSSSELNFSNAYRQTFSNGTQHFSLKFLTTLRVRAIRAF